MKRNSRKNEAEKFDNSEDLAAYFDLIHAKRPGKEQMRVNVDFPLWMIQSLDREAKRIGVTRQSIIKTWIADRLKTTS
ncbi:CopG family transcriptional regulator [candidate division KSB1 bacterium]|nr:CopG family transcriptional regulator [candidate division KSB1 bacterium]